MVMPVINLKLDGDGAWPDLKREDVIEAGGAIGMAPLAGGMSSGKTSVTLRIDLPDGRTVLAQTSLAALSVAIKAIWARYGDPGAT